MDALSEILNSVRVRSTVYCPVEITAPWGLTLPKESGAPFFILNEGSAYLEIDELDIKQHLNAGDFLIITKNCECKVSDSPGSKHVLLDEWLKRHHPRFDGTYKIDGTGPITRFTGGTFFFENHESHPLLKVLPTFLYFSKGELNSQNRGREWLRSTLDFISSEAASYNPGSEILIHRLSDILFIKAVRTYALSYINDNKGWFAAASDPQIGQAIVSIHNSPAHSWTVEELATHSGMSRSAFADKFNDMVGEPPMRYLTRWRMHRAIEMLSENKLSTAEIANQTGYENESSFSKAFKKWHGQSPGTYRR